MAISRAKRITRNHTWWNIISRVNPTIEIIEEEYKKPGSYTCKGVLEIKRSDFYLDENWNDKPVPKRLVGFWVTHEIIRYYSDPRIILLSDVCELERITPKVKI